MKRDLYDEVVLLLQDSVNSLEASVERSPVWHCCLTMARQLVGGTPVGMMNSSSDGEITRSSHLGSKHGAL